MNMYTDSFSYYSDCVRNDIPNKIRNDPRLTNFKEKLKKVFTT